LTDKGDLEANKVIKGFLQQTLLVLLILAVAPLAHAQGDRSKDKSQSQPNAKKSYEEVSSKFLQQLEQAGVAFNCFVKGGLSRSEDHEIWMHQVYEEHQGSILGNLMVIPELDVYRTPKKGALRNAGNWVPLVSTPAGKRLEKVLHFPAELFRRGLREGIGTVAWAPVPVVKEVELDHPDFAEPDESVVGGGTAVKEMEPEYLFDRLKLRLAQKSAVEFFNDVQKSGCLGGLG